MGRKKIYFLMLIFILIAFLKPNPGNSQTQYDGLHSNIEVKLIIEYNLITTLNKNGADVSYYANMLNLCLNLLDRAGKYNSAGDNKNAISTLQLTISILNSVDNDTKTALTEYYSKGYTTYISNSAIPIVTTIIIAIFAAIFWIVYKQYYFAKLMKMKPEVTKNEIK
jgi:hypothetical protein